MLCPAAVNAAAAAVWLLAVLGPSLSLPAEDDSEPGVSLCTHCFYRQTPPQGASAGLLCHSLPEGQAFATLSKPTCDTAVFSAFHLSHGWAEKEGEELVTKEEEENIKVSVPALLRGGGDPSHPVSPTDSPLQHWDSTVTTLVQSSIFPQCSTLGGDLYILTGVGGLGAAEDGDEECQTKPLWSAVCCAIPEGKSGFSMGLIRETGEGERQVSVKELEEILGVAELFSEGCGGADGETVGIRVGLHSEGLPGDIDKLDADLTGENTEDKDVDSNTAGRVTEGEEIDLGSTEGEKVGSGATEGEKVGSGATEGEEVDSGATEGEKVGLGATEGEEIGSGATKEEEVGSVATEGEEVGSGATKGEEVGSVATEGEEVGSGATKGEEVGSVATKGEEVGSGATKGEEVGSGTTKGEEIGSGATEGEEVGSGATEGIELRDLIHSRAARSGSPESSADYDTADKQETDTNSSSTLMYVLSTTLSILKAPLQPVFSTVTKLPGQVTYVLQEDLGVLSALPGETYSLLHLLTSDLLSWTGSAGETLLGVGENCCSSIYYCSSSMLGALMNSCHTGVTGMGTLAGDTVGILGDALDNTWWVTKFFGGQLWKQSEGYVGTVMSEMGGQTKAVGGGLGRLVWKIVKLVFNVFRQVWGLIAGTLDIFFGAVKWTYGQE